MKIIKTDLKFKSLDMRNLTEYAVVHHSGSDTDNTESIHKWHKEGNGWSGIGYHYVIERDGSIHEGRPINSIGAHVLGNNHNTLGICICGDLEKHPMINTQEKSLKELLKYIKEKYPEIQFAVHKDFMETTCPGKYFNHDILNLNKEINDIDEALKILVDKNIINSPNYWKNASQLVVHFKQFILNVANHVN